MTEFDERIDHAIDGLKDQLTGNNSGLNIVSEAAVLGFLSGLLLQILQDMLADGGKALVYKAIGKDRLTALKTKVLALWQFRSVEDIKAGDRFKLQEKVETILKQMGFPPDKIEKIASVLIEAADQIAKHP